MLFELEVQRLYVSEIAAGLGYIEIAWQRAKNYEGPNSYKSKTRIPILPLAIPDTLTEADRSGPAIVECHCPGTVRLHEPFRASYRLVLPKARSAAPRVISYAMDSAPNNFVFTGPRKTDRCLILPDESRPAQILADFTMIAIGGTGLVDLPVLRVWEVQETPAQEEERRRRRLAQEQAIGTEVPDEGPPMRVLRLERAGSRIVDLQDGADPAAPPVQVYVLPR